MCSHLSFTVYYMFAVRELVYFRCVRMEFIFLVCLIVEFSLNVCLVIPILNSQEPFTLGVDTKGSVHGGYLIKRT